MQSPTIAWKYRFIQVPATQSGSLPLPQECNSFLKCMQSFNVAGTTFTCSLCDVSLSGEDFSSGKSILLMKIRAVKHPSARGRTFVHASFFCKFQRGSAAGILSETLNFSQNERGNHEGFSREHHYCRTVCNDRNHVSDIKRRWICFYRIRLRRSCARRRIRHGRGSRLSNGLVAWPE